MKKIIYIHGRNYKPPKDELLKNWCEAIAFAIKRDFSDDSATKFKKTSQEMAYYGDYSNKFLASRERENREPYEKYWDINSRRFTFEALKQYTKDDFKREVYNSLERKNAIPEFLADISATLLQYVGLGKLFVSFVAKDTIEYWKRDSDFYNNLRKDLKNKLLKSFEKDDDILLISHSLGVVIAYDLLWEFSHNPEYKDISHKKIATFITMGAPIGNPTAKNALLGSKNKTPTNILTWYNIAAEDDFVAHDEYIDDDFQQKIQDIQIYNLSVRNHKSDPHHSTGYLISPELAELVVSWLEDSA